LIPRGPAPHQPDARRFPAYTARERLVDMVVHALCIVGVLIGAVWLVWGGSCCTDGTGRLSLFAYMVALGGMVFASSAYNALRTGRAKEILRRVDHAMIYALIAGTYTPFAVHHMDHVEGIGTSLWIVWGVALAGVCLKLAFPRRLERLGLALYLGLGWALLVLGMPMWGAVGTLPMVLLAVGGVLYTLGTAVHLAHRVAYHNAAWHVFVLVAAGCHFAAVVLETTT
jgi:hemolysin III